MKISRTILQVTSLSPNKKENNLRNSNFIEYCYLTDPATLTHPYEYKQEAYLRRTRYVISVAANSSFYGELVMLQHYLLGIN